jgi:hypothetical protein
MFQFLFKLLLGRSILVLLVDTSDKDEIERHIATLELILSGLPSARRITFASLGANSKPSPENESVSLIDANGAAQTFSREMNPKLLMVLDYLYDYPEANEISLRRLAATIDVSKSTVDEAKRLWSLPENQDAFARFREEEDANAPF